MSFSKVKALKPPMSVFDLSYEKKFDFDFGQLIPVACEEMVPGDTFKVGNEIVIRFNSMFAPVLQEINAYVHYFFVPTRLIWDDWEEFITGGEDGPTSELSGPMMPRFNPKTGSGGWTLSQICGPYSLYDYFGFPVMDYQGYPSYPGINTNVSSAEYYFRPLSFPWRCVNLIWNEYYRDENLQYERDLDDPTVPLRNWSKDYFTSALKKQQRGTAPALPISGILPVTFNSLTQYVKGDDVGGSDITDPQYRGALAWLTGEVDDPQIVTDESDFDARLGKVTNDGLSGSVNLSGAATIDVSDLRVIFQVQKWMERNQRSGVRYTEFLHSHWSVSPRDDRLQRPEYLGGSKSPIIVNEVVQTAGDTSEDPTPIGKLYGKGITADKNYVFTYKAKEFGYLVGLLSVLPKITYCSQGVDRQWLRKSRWDFAFPEFSHLSEQEVITEEIYAFPGATLEPGTTIGNGYKFGYQARYNEMRANKSKVCGALRDSLDYWHLGRKFDSVPQLNSDFITCDPTNDDLKRIFQVQNVPGMICNFANIITAIRPIPKYGEPGLVDHY